MVDGVPVLIDDDRSVFRVEEFLERKQTTFRRGGALKRLVGRALPSGSVNLKGRANYATLERLLMEAPTRPRVLVVGGGILGQGMEMLAANEGIEFVHSDVALEPLTELIADCHQLPFPEGYFDAVIAQAVLEHVADPYQCVAEMHRTLKPDGIVYIEIPFLQGVHMGRYDFTRFTDLGLRRLCRGFEEIERGAVCGTGMALADMYQAFLKSLTRSRRVRYALVAFGRLTSFWLKYFDYFSIDTPASLDAASGLFFMGRKSNKIITDRELITLFRGASTL
jgi:SAM-dependent methyltransferase